MTDSYFNATSIFFQGCGILITGKPGSGKSSLALALLDKGAQLISDDITCLNVCDRKLMALPPSLIAGGLEVRGLGLVSIPNSLKKPVQIHMLIELNEGKSERCPADFQYVSVHGIKIPAFQFKMFEFALTNKVIMAIKLLKKEIVFFKQPD